MTQISRSDKAIALICFLFSF